jgi:eukaryotic-like serine/threonine-protein kinase
MTLVAGTRLGMFEITGHLGAGGMGEVYRATDTKLGREVAIKMLPAALASDKDRLARFEREAKLLAALNHAHIASVYTLDDHEGTLYIAMELVEGETLEEKLKGGALPVEDALRLALQIAEALEAAHDKGVIHRDLKPANVMVTRDGTVKVLDFGLAKAFSDDESTANAAQSPSLSVAMTQQGLVLGTAGYMSPEQASGQSTDQRADIWAFGVVLHEMLTGLPLFSGESVPHILADVLKTEPDWSRLPKNLHPRLKLMLERCLTKKPRDRYSGIADARVDIQSVLSDPAGSLPQPAGPITARSRLLWRRVLVPIAASIVAGALLGYLVFSYMSSSDATLPSYRFSISTAPSAIRALSISPNGRYVAFVSSNADNANQIWLRDLESEDYRPLSGTEDLRRGALFWSPDSENLAFNLGSELMRVSVGGLPPEPMLNIEALLPSFGEIQGGAWSLDGTILLGTQRGIVAILPSGEPISVTESGGADVRHSYPSFLPDGRRFVYLVSTTGDASRANNGIYLGTTDRNELDGNTGRILRSDSPAIFVEEKATRDTSDGYLIYERAGQLLARSFDPDGPEIGEERALAATAPSSLQGGLISRPYAAAATGTLVYLDSNLVGESRLVWYDRQGNTVGQFEEPRDYGGVRFSSGGDMVIVGLGEATGESHAWYSKLDLPRWTRVTTEDAIAGGADVSATGRFVMNKPTDDGAVDIFGGILGQANLTLWWSNPNTKHVNDFSRDGRFVVWDEHVAPGNQDLFLLEIGEDGVPVGGPIAVADSSADESFGQFSPDGNWIAYDSNEEGSYEVFIKPISLEERVMVETRGLKVSSQGGQKPRWSADGRELFYLAPGNNVMAVDVDTSEGQLRPRTPEVLFEHPQISSFMPWDVSPDGRFLFVTSALTQAKDPIHVYMNWTEVTSD